jgi:hypothetical protein
MICGKAGVAGKVVRHKRGPRYCSLGLRLRDPLKLEQAIRLAGPMALGAGSRKVISGRREEAPDLVTFQFELRRGLWRHYTRGDLEGLAIGVTEHDAPCYFSFDNSAHAGVFGTTGSGKTEAVRTAVHAMASVYQPDQMKMVILDRHHDYESYRNLQHLALPVASSEELTDQTLEWVSNELTRRITSNERDATPLVVVIDEAANILSDPRRMAIVRQIGDEARKVNVHLILATQKPSQKNLPDLLPNILNRYVGLVDDAQTSVRLTGKAQMSCHRLTGKGDFMHVEGPTSERVQVALTTQKDLALLPFGDVPEMPEVVMSDTPTVTNIPLAKPGRPPNKLEPDILAWYMATGPESVSIRTAKELAGISRGMHNLHRPFAQRVLDELRRLGHEMSALRDK